jgi:hypothetical protein
MELPPSGWYPDPYGVPGLLRWWDGSAWTEHTHQASGTDAAGSAEPSGTAQPGAQSTTVQPAVQPGAQSTTVQPAVQAGAQPTTVQPAVQPTTVQPAVQPTVYQPAVTAVQPTTVQPGVQPGIQPTTVQPTTVQPPTVQPPTVRPGGQPGGPGPDANGTQVLFLGEDAWGTGGPGHSTGDRFGYQRVQRRRRIWMMSGLAGGTAVALGVVALVVTNLGSSPPAPSPTHTSRPVAATKPPASPSHTPSPTPSATPSGSLIDDSTSGLSYTSLTSPWVPNCPGTLNTQGFSWTEGQSAVAGQVNGGQTTWYGVACSAPLPQQYGYNGVQDLQNVTTNVVNAFANSYYSALQHGFQQQVSQPLSISGHAGWEIKFLMTYTNPQGQGLQFTSEEGAVVVADLGSTIPPAVFFVSIPANLGSNNVDSLVSSLQLTTPSVPGGGGSPGDGSPGDGSPAGGSPGDGGGNQN